MKSQLSIPTVPTESDRALALQIFDDEFRTSDEDDCAEIIRGAYFAGDKVNPSTFAVIYRWARKNNIRETV